MTIIAVDNLLSRLTKMQVLLGEIYPDGQIAAFNDPFFAVQYSVNNQIDTAFIHKNIRPIDFINESKLIRKFNEDVKIYVIADDLHNYLNTISCESAGKIIDGFIENQPDRVKIEELLFTPQSYFYPPEVYSEKASVNHQSLTAKKINVSIGEVHEKCAILSN